MNNISNKRIFTYCLIKWSKQVHGYRNVDLFNFLF